MGLVFWIHFAATWAMIGANVFVSIVHYPGFKFFSGDDFGAFEKFHTYRTLRLAIPVLCVEGATALLLIIFSFQWLFVINALLLAIIWVFTFRKCVPCHLKMQDQFCPLTFDSLSRYHTLRVTLWITRGVLLFFVKKASLICAC